MEEDKNEQIINCYICNERDCATLYKNSYICKNCKFKTKNINQCDWCGEYVIGQSKDSMIMSKREGCGFCNGKGYDDD
jgi:hypothetical protein